jgi:hypothetical protein
LILFCNIVWSQILWYLQHCSLYGKVWGALVLVFL